MTAGIDAFALEALSRRAAPPRYGGGFALARALQRTPLKVFADVAKHGDFVALTLPYIRRQMFFLNSPELAEEVLMTQQHVFKKTMHGYDLMRRLLGNGLVTAEGELWRQQRRIVQPAFHRDRIGRWADDMADKAERMLDGWHGRIDLHEQMMHLTLSIVGQALLSSDLGQREQAFSRALNEILSQMIWRTLQPLQLPLSLPTPQNLRFVRAKREIDAIISEVIDARRASEPRGDLLDMLLAEPISRRQVADETLTLFFAGHETTATALTWVFAALCDHPEVEANVRAELSRVLAGRRAGAEDIPSLPYLNAVIKETLRLYTPVWIIPRAAEQPTELQGVRIDQGAYVFISPYLLHRREREWHNAEAFRPERFLHGPKPRAGAYLPFLQGARKCAGEAFALMEMAIVVASVLQRVRLQRINAQPSELLPQITLKPKGGMPMRVQAIR